MIRLDNGQNFIASQVGLRTVSYTFDKTSALAETEGVVKVIKAGTIYPANDATAVGVLLHDVQLADRDFNAKDGIGALIVAGHLYSDKLPVAPASAAVTALAAKGLYFEEQPTTSVPADGTIGA